MNHEIEKLARGNSPLHTWDARWKLVSLAVFVLVIAVLQSIWSAFIAVLFALALLFISALPKRVVLRRLGIIQMLLLPGLIIIPFSVGFQELGWLHFSWNGFLFALTLYLRAVAILTISAVLLFSTPMRRLLRAGESIGVPRVLIQVAMLTYRYIYTLSRELTSVRWALATRGFRSRFRWESYRALSNVIGMTLVRSLERTDRVYRAMQCRGYQGYIHTLETFQTRSMDIGKSAIVSLAAIGLLFFDRWHG